MYAHIMYICIIHCILSGGMYVSTYYVYMYNILYIEWWYVCKHILWYVYIYCILSGVCIIGTLSGGMYVRY